MNLQSHMVFAQEKKTTGGRLITQVSRGDISVLRRAISNRSVSFLQDITEKDWLARSSLQEFELAEKWWHWSLGQAQRRRSRPDSTSHTVMCTQLPLISELKSQEFSAYVNICHPNLSTGLKHSWVRGPAWQLFVSKYQGQLPKRSMKNNQSEQQV